MPKDRWIYDGKKLFHYLLFYLFKFVINNDKNLSNKKHFFLNLILFYKIKNTRKI